MAGGQLENHLKLHWLPRRSIYRKLIMKAQEIWKLLLLSFSKVAAGVATNPTNRT